VRAGLEFEAGRGRGPLHHPREARRREGCPPLITKTKGEDSLSRWSRRSARSSSPRRGWVLGGAVLDPPDVNNGGAELDLVPAQVAELDFHWMWVSIAIGQTNSSEARRPCRKAIRISGESNCHSASPYQATLAVREAARRGDRHPRDW